MVAAVDPDTSTSRLLRTKENLLYLLLVDAILAVTEHPHLGVCCGYWWWWWWGVDDLRTREGTHQTTRVFGCVCVCVFPLPKQMCMLC